MRAPRHIQRAMHVLSARASAQDGFTLIMALGVMFVAAILMAVAFKAASSDIQLSHKDATQKQAYYAALAGIQEYEYRLQANPDYWQTCATPTGSLKEEENTKEEEHYEIKLLPASTAPVGTTGCSTSNPVGTMIQSKGSAANTFRIESIGTWGKPGQSGYDKRKLIATFRVVGFLNYIYFTEFEVEDPEISEPEGSPECAHYKSEREKLGVKCNLIVFTSGDSIEGPMHTDDAVDLCGKASFGRAAHNPPDAVEINGGVYSTCGGSEAEATFNTSNKKYSTGLDLLPPESDTSLATYVKEGGYEFTGVTHIELVGSKNQIVVTKSNGASETLSWPKNGLIFVKASSTTACKYEYRPDKSDDAFDKTLSEESTETNCGNVYVKGTYSSSLTIGAEENLIINGNIYPTSVEGNLGSEPTGIATLGLIASDYVRIYHPLTASNCSSSAKNEKGSLSSPWIYAAILSTSHSFVVDNFDCGEELGKLHVYGAIAQRFRGIVGTTGGTGYIKDYKYDERLAVDEPPYFLNPINAGWEVARETAPEPG
jgi:Tfp pilus assembly protein PilE